MTACCHRLLLCRHGVAVPAGGVGVPGIHPAVGVHLSAEPLHPGGALYRMGASHLCHGHFKVVNCLLSFLAARID